MRKSDNRDAASQGHGDRWGPEVDATDAPAAAPLPDRASVSSAYRSYAPVLDALPDGILIVADGQIQYANLQAEALLGCPAPDALIGYADTDFVGTDFHEALKARHAALDAGGEPTDDDIEMVRTDGVAIPVRLRMSRLGAGSGAVTMTIGKRMSVRHGDIGDAAKLFGNIAQNIPSLLFQRVLADDGSIRYTYVNEAAFDIVGFSAKEIMEDPSGTLDCFHPDDRESHLEALQSSYRDLTLFADDFRYFHPQLGLRWLHTISRPRRLADGTVVSEGICYDVTDRKTAEQELEASRRSLHEHIVELQDTRDRLEQRTNELVRTISDLAEMRDAAEAANRAKSDFLATMSHEIRTPMNGVLGMANLLMQTELRDDQRDYVSFINQSGQALLDIINDILDFSKMEAGSLRLEETEFCLPDIIDGAMQVVRSKCADRGLELRSFVAASAPDVVTGDPGRLRQILINLLGNAAKFTEKGWISIELLPPQPVGRDIELHFTVSDSGIGIDDQAASRLFTVFSQADASTTRKYGGTGLGLSICKKLTTLMGGDISVESTPGKGSTFRFSIKCRAGSSAQPSAVARSRRTRDAAILVGKPGPRDYGLRRQLAEFGFQVIDAADEPTALRLLAEQGTDVRLLLIDDESPEDAGATASAIRIDATTPLPPIWITRRQGTSQKGDYRPGETAGAVAIELPLRHRPLRGVVAKLFASIEDGPGDGTVPAAAVAEEQGEEPAKVSVLLVEDNLINQRVACAMLERTGIDISIAENGLQALDRLAESDFDVILMDIHMPEMDGVTATREIRRLPPPKCDTPVIALTANAMKGDREKYLAAGMDDYVSKPVDPKTLTAAVMRHTKHRGEIDTAPAAPQPRVEDGGGASAAEVSVLLDRMDAIMP